MSLSSRRYLAIYGWVWNLDGCERGGPNLVGHGEQLGAESSHYTTNGGPSDHVLYLESVKEEKQKKPNSCARAWAGVDQRENVH